MHILRQVGAQDLFLFLLWHLVIKDELNKKKQTENVSISVADFIMFHVLGTR